MSDPLVNLEAEADLLGSLMRENALIERCADFLKAEDFADPTHARIYSALVREASLGRSANPITIKGYFENDDGMNALGGVAYLGRLTGSATVFSAGDASRHLTELALRRRMRSGLVTAADGCADLEATIPEIVAHADAAMSATQGDNVIEMTAGECVSSLMAAFGQDRAGVSSGCIECLDQALGPMRPKQLVIGAGRPGMGKTAVALSYGLGAASQGHGVLFVSLEMSGAELGERMLSDQCFDGREGVQYSAIRDGRLNNWQHNRVGQAAEHIDTLPFKIIDTGNLTIGRLNMLIRRNARRMAARGQKLELVIIDYLQLLRSDRKLSRYEEITEISMSLKAMAKDHNVAIFALAQLSREVEKRADKRPQLSDLRDSGQIEQDADAVVFLYRAEHYVRMAEAEHTGDKRHEWEQALHKVSGLIDFNVAKRRNGEAGMATGRFFGAYQAVRG